jgi:segregation and condensation protein B
MDATEIKYFVEAALLAAGRPLNIDQLQKLFDGRMAPEKAEIRQAIQTLNEEYELRGITIAEVASGFRVQVKARMADRLQKLWEERPPRYSRALFETLALVAYRQPITRGEIEEIRGVSVSSNIVRTLLERDWVRVVGHRDVPGRPEMFATTKLFLDYFGLKKLDDLPPLADLSDWESLRVQLNLPAVEEDTSSDERPAANDLPVLYPEIPEDSDEDVEELAANDKSAPEDEIPGLLPVADEVRHGEEELIVSEWPDPAEGGA